MSPESPPIHKIPDTPEFRAAMAAHEKTMRDSEARRQKEKKLGNVHIFSKEESTQIHAEVERRLAEQRKKIEGMN